ncbi:hypothetical protein [Aeoliella sp.]|uniref:hypothetical protein n=1 Tax=Aeoliella sp. TaxID=2795800 RepID=UPI003CCC0755
MSDFRDFLHSKILRNPTTWIVAVIGGAYGGTELYSIREAKRAAGAEVQFPWLWLERSVDILFGATFQVVFLLCAVWMVAGLMEDSNVWVRQGAVVAIYLGLNYLTTFL